MPRTLLLAGNWKMNKTARDAAAYAEELIPRVRSITAAEILICPPFTALQTLHAKLRGTNVQLGAQNLSWKEQGAFTGEISAAMLREFDVRFAIVGHSERRQYLDETNETIAKKVQAALAAGITPILCVGENAMQRKTKRERSIVHAQLAAALKALQAKQIMSTVIAYEPIWAIGTGKTATPKQAQEMHAAIRQWLVQQYDERTAAAVRIIYGGSANPENCRALLEQPDIDGALPGGASLDPAVFATMAGIAESVARNKR